MKLRASLVVASALMALGATAKASILPEASESAPVPRSLYSPTPVARQPITLRTLRATSARYFAAPVYGSPSPVGHFESGPIASVYSFVSVETPSASLSPSGAKETL
jgi:hypothetical protein